jgi:integrase
MEKYIIKRGNIYCYRRRVPKSLAGHLQQGVYTKCLSQSLSQANKLANIISGQFANALLQVHLGQVPDITGLIGTLPSITKPVVDASMKFSDIAKEYIATLSVKNTRLKAYQSIIDTVSIITKDEINHASLDKLKTVLEGMPKRNIQRYKVMSVSAMMKLKVPEEERVSSRNVKEYLVLVNSVLKFGFERGYYDKPYKARIVKITKNVRAERKALDYEKVMWLIEGAKRCEVADAYKILYLSGMRLSELFKCTITLIDGVKCFDLRDTMVELKTAASHRLIPVHDLIADSVEEMLIGVHKLNLKYLSNITNIRLGDGESLYSLRHSFATHLVATGVRSEVLSELMGHTHKSMSLSRYAKGFPIKMLHDAVNQLC